LNNPYFQNYNELPLDNSNDRIYYFNNLIDDATASRDDLHLSVNPLGVAAEDTIKKVSKKYNYVHGSIVSAGMAKLKHTASKFEIEPKSHTNDGVQSYLTFDLTGFPVGMCEIVINGSSVETAYHLNEVTESPVFAVIECSLNAIDLDNYRIVEEDGSITPLRPHYGLLFKNRSTFWKYKLVLDDQSPLYNEIINVPPAQKEDFINSIQIITNDLGLKFVTNTISDKHIEFVSTTIKGMQEHYISSSSGTNDPLTLALKKYVDFTSVSFPVDIKANLPYPQKHQLDATSTPVLYSVVLLNL